MPKSIRFLALGLAVASAACGVTLSPRVEVGDGFADSRRGLPASPSAPEVPAGGGVAAREICRTGATPRGWIAVRYTSGNERCLPSPNQDDQYATAVIHRYSDAPLGSSMTVCADQGLPQGWTRVAGRAPDSECPGARVREGAPTTYVMRRIH